MGDRFISGREGGLDRSHLGGMDDLLAGIAQAGAELRLGADDLQIPEIDRDNVDGLQVEGGAGRDDCLAGIQQFDSLGGARGADRGGEILPAENDAVRRGCEAISPRLRMPRAVSTPTSMRIEFACQPCSNSAAWMMSLPQ